MYLEIFWHVHCNPPPHPQNNKKEEIRSKKMSKFIMVILTRTSERTIKISWLYLISRPWYVYQMVIRKQLPTVGFIYSTHKSYSYIKNCFLHTCASITELPSNIGTMVLDNLLLLWSEIKSSRVIMLNLGFVSFSWSIYYMVNPLGLRP